MNNYFHILFLLLVLPSASYAEHAYIIDKTQVGIHQEKSVDSPILQLLTTGSTLEVLHRSEKMTSVLTEKGIQGWIKNEYLMKQPSARDELEQLKKQNQSLRAQLQDSDLVSSAELNSTPEIQSLQATVAAERLRASQLEAELLQIKQKPQGHDETELYEHIAQVEQENLRLYDELQQFHQPNGEGSFIQDLKLLYHRGPELKRHLVYLMVLLIIGIVIGLFINDFISRQRHGGFRV